LWKPFILKSIFRKTSKKLKSIKDLGKTDERDRIDPLKMKAINQSRKKSNIFSKFGINVSQN